MAEITKEVEQDFETCPYKTKSYYESDTGYVEYYCELCNWECAEECPLNFKVTIKEE